MFQQWDESEAEKIIAGFGELDGALLPILHAVQERFGYIPDAATPLIAKELNLSRAEVHGVVSFYHDFRTAPPPRLVVKVCRAEACQAVGARQAAQALLTNLGLDWDQPASDQSVVVEPVYCLGLCALAPAAMIGEDLVSGLDGAELIKAVNAAL